MNDTERLLALIAEQSVKAEAGDYSSLAEDDSQFFRENLSSLVSVPIQGGWHTLVNACGTHIANSYNRIVIGDFGIYVELTNLQINLSQIISKWPGEPLRPISYVWLITDDRCKTKIYHQRRCVHYADYIPGMYYVSYFDVDFLYDNPVECL